MLRYVTLMLLLASSPSYAGLTGKARVDFMNYVTTSCLQNQRAAQANVGWPDDALQFYCDCTASQLADTLTDAEAGLTSITLEQGQRVREACLTKTLERYPRK
jgi:hypothetical protein